MLLRPLLVSLALSTSVAHAATPTIEAEPPQDISDAHLAEVVDFVVGNAVYALYHQAGHMMMQRYGVRMDGGEQAADDFAVLTLLEPRTGAGDQTLVDAIDSWMLSNHLTASAQPEAIGLSDRHALDAERTNNIVCDMVGANSKDFADVAEAASLTPAARTACATSYQQKRALWTEALKPLARAPGTPATTIAVSYDEPTGGEIAEVTILHDNRVLEEVAARLANDFALSPAPTIRAMSCGSATSNYDAAKNELVFCYELASYHAELILRDIAGR
ncbi:DUF4344 domain-containing metallopeptidase [Kaistia adipata]|uniref:DUF4344 domain-containing metallopeptidase n=1 Tax=Kaistia adipata TaxID=166954 RepID=UPI000423A97D|nr:DUF4344 domain-containing metallopeptidase [Kaistia adipata]